MKIGAIKEKVKLVDEGSIEVKLPTIWTDESRDGKSIYDKRSEEKRREDQRRESPKKDDPGARKGRKAAKYCVFQ